MEIQDTLSTQQAARLLAEVRAIAEMSYRQGMRDALSLGMSHEQARIYYEQGQRTLFRFCTDPLQPDCLVSDGKRPMRPLFMPMLESLMVNLAF